MKPGLTALEFGDRTYVFSLDTGLFTLGAPRKDEGGAPAPEGNGFKTLFYNFYNVLFILEVKSCADFKEKRNLAIVLTQNMKQFNVK